MLPEDFYLHKDNSQLVFHRLPQPTDQVQHEWSEHFEILGHFEGGINKLQDAVLLKGRQQPHPVSLNGKEVLFLSIS